MRESIFVLFFGGAGREIFLFPEWEELLHSLVRWLLPIGIYLLLAGACLEGRQKNQLLSCYRYGDFRKWWKHRFWKEILTGFSGALLVMFFLVSLDIFSGDTKPISPAEIGKICVLWLAHIAVLHSLFLLIDLFGGQKFGPGLLLLAETATFLMGLCLQGTALFRVGTWGMYLQSSWYDKGQGFPAVMIIIWEALLVEDCYIVGKMLLKKRQYGDLERKVFL